MKKKPTDELTVQAKDCYDPADYTLVHNQHLRRLRSRKAVDGDWTDLAQRIAARLGRADAWGDVLAELTGEPAPAVESTSVPKDSGESGA